MGLRLSETLSLQVCDIDGERHRVHIRIGKGHKDRFVPLPAPQLGHAPAGERFKPASYPGSAWS